MEDREIARLDECRRFQLERGVVGECVFVTANEIERADIAHIQLVAPGGQEVLNRKTHIVYAGHLIVDTRREVHQEVGHVAAGNQRIARAGAGGWEAVQVAGTHKVRGIESIALEVGFDTRCQRSGAPEDAESIVNTTQGIAVVANLFGGDFKW